MSKIKKANSKVSKKTENFKIELDGETITVDKEALRPFLSDSNMELIEMDEDERQHRYEIEEAIGIVQTYQGAINDLPAKLKNNREVVMAAVDFAGENLQYVKKSFRKDKEVVMEAVKLNAWDHGIQQEVGDGEALEFADKSLKKDKKIVLAAVESNGYAFEFADKSLKKDRKFVLKAVKLNGTALYYADDTFKKDKKIVLAAVQSDGDAIRYADESLQKDPDILKAAGKIKP